MKQREWMRSGPRVFGYEPGWLWWAAVLVALAVGGVFGAAQLQRYLDVQSYIDDRIAHHAESQGLDIDLVHAVVQAESGRDWKATSPVGAKGLMQVTDIAHRDVMQRESIRDGDLYEIDYNLRVGTLYLAYLLDRFDDDVALSVAAYHMGPTAVARGQRKYPDLSPREMIDKHSGPQTRAYVKKVLGKVDRP